MIRYFKIVALLALPLFFAFLSFKSQKPEMDREDLIKYIAAEEHGTCRSVLSEGVTYKLLFKPTDLMVLQAMQSAGGKQKNADSLRKQYEDCIYFILSLSRNDKEIFGAVGPDYDALLKTASFGLKEQVTLKDETSGELFYLADFIHPRVYGASPATKILLCFKDRKLLNTGDLTLYLTDFVNNSPEKLKFKFKRKDLEKIPALKL